MNLSNFNAQQLSAYLKGAADKIAEDSAKRLEFQPLFLSALEDMRGGVWQGAIHYYPLPYEGDLPQETKKGIDRGVYLLEHLPGLYSANSTVIRKSLKIEAYKLQTGDDRPRDIIYTEFQNAARAALIADKFWLTALTHPLPAIRRAAVKRIPVKGSVLSVLLPWMTGDNDVTVRRQAKWSMGIEGRDKRIYRQGMSAPELVAKASLGVVSEATLESLLADTRSSVRYAAALRLDADSVRWPYLARDVSPRLRRLAAERLPLGAPELEALSRDPVASVAALAEKRLRPKVGQDGKRIYWWNDEEEKK